MLLLNGRIEASEQRGLALGVAFPVQDSGRALDIDRGTKAKLYAECGVPELLSGLQSQRVEENSMRLGR